MERPLLTNETADLRWLVEVAVEARHDEADNTLEEDAKCEAVPWANPIGQEGAQE